MKEFNNFKGLFNHIEDKIKDSLETDVADMGKEKMREHVQIDVYDSYTPTHYQRTGGLLRDVEAEMVNDNTLEIKDTRHDGDRDIVKIISEGKGYNWGYTRNLDEEIGPRPFVSNTRDEIREENLAAKTLKESLNKKGFKTE